MQDGTDFHFVFRCVRGNRVHDNLGDRRVCPKRRFHFEAGNILASPAKIILLSVEEIEEALLTELADVARVEPEITERRHRSLGTPPITVEHDMRLQRPHNDLARYARSALPVGIVENS